MNLHKGNIARLIRIMAIVITIIPALSACRKYAGDEQAVARSLAVADSLRYDHSSITDSILRSLCPDSLGSSANNALYAVLANEAGLYSENAFEADSIADIAIEHYRLRSWLSDSCRRLYARALMQKAITLYDKKETDNTFSTAQRAIELIDTTDASNNNLIADAYFTLAVLYAETDAPVANFIEMYKKANRYYTLGNSKQRTMKCMCIIGAYYRGTNMDSAYKYMNLSLNMARELNDSTYIFRNLAHIERAYYIEKRYRECKDLSLYALSHCGNYVPRNEILFDLCKSYARLGLIDSAEYFKSQIIISSKSQMDRYKIHSINEVLSLSKGDHLSAYKYLDSASKLSAKIVEQGKFIEMHEMNKKYDYTQVKLKNKILQNTILYILIILIFTALVITVIIMRHRRKRHETELFIYQLKNSLTEYETNMLHYIDKNNELSSKVESLQQSDNIKISVSDAADGNNRLVTYLSSYISQTMKVCDYTCRMSEHKYPKFTSDFQNEIKKISLPSDFNDVVKSHINMKYSNLMSDIEENYDIHDEKKLSIIALGIIGLSREMICSILDISNKGNLATILHRIYKRERNGLTLKDFITDRTKKSIETL